MLTAELVTSPSLFFGRGSPQISQQNTTSGVPRSRHVRTKRKSTLPYITVVKPQHYLVIERSGRFRVIISEVFTVLFVQHSQRMPSTKMVDES